MKKLIIIITLICLTFPALSFGKGLDNLKFKIVNGGRTLFCQNKFFACYLPDENLIVFDRLLFLYPPQVVKHTILHEICHHLTYIKAESVEQKELKAEVCANNFETLLK